MSKFTIVLVVVAFIYCASANPVSQVFGLGSFGNSFPKWADISYNFPSDGKPHTHSVVVTNAQTVDENGKTQQSGTILTNTDGQKRVFNF